MNKVKAINRAMWEKDVIRDSERSGRKASRVSLRADDTLNETYSLLADRKNDPATAVREQLAKLDETCERRL